MRAMNVASTSKSDKGEDGEDTRKKRRKGMIHSYYTNTKEQLLESPKLRLECYETKEEVFQQMAQEMAEEIEEHNKKGEKTHETKNYFTLNLIYFYDNYACFRFKW